MKKQLTIFLTTLLVNGLNYSFAQGYQWAKNMGGIGATSEGNSITYDASGNVYSTGIFTGTVDFDPGSGTHNLTSVGRGDIYIQKLDVNGNFLWAKSIGGTEWENPTSIAVDKLGNVYTKGYYTDTVDFDPGNGIFNLISESYQDIFIQKLDGSGNFLWAKSFADYFPEKGSSITIDNSGNIYSTGFFSGTVDFDPGPAIYNLTSNGGPNAYILKLDANGNFTFAFILGNNAASRGRSITVDDSGNIYTTGEFSDSADFDPGPGVYYLLDGGIFISKLDSSGNFLWAQGVTLLDQSGPNSIAVDINQNVYVTGYVTSYMPSETEMVVIKIDSIGNNSWNAIIPSISGGSHGYSIAADAYNGVYVTGIFYGIVDFDPGPGIHSLTASGGVYILILKLDSSGNFLWVKDMGDDSVLSDDAGNSLAVDSSGSIYATGTFQGTVDFNPGSGINNLTYHGAKDAFVLKWSSCSDNAVADVVSACNNYTWIDGITYTASNNTATDTLINAGGCDSIITLNLTILATASTDIITSCDSYTWIDGTTYTASNNTAIDTLINAAGCDSIITLNLTILATASTDIITACNSFIWIDGITYTASNNTATDTLLNAAGCDSVITLNLTILATTSTDVVTACNSFTWIDGNTYTASNNTATDTLINAAGCDSVITLNLTILASASTDTVTACDSYKWINNVTYTSSNNTATVILTNIYGCDSVITLNLTILATASTDIITACNSYTWIDGTTYTASNNTATDTLINAAGCDSVITLNLIILATSSTDVVTACDSYTWVDGNTYTASNNTATDTLVNASGCDSVITLNLTINSVSDITTTVNDVTITSNNTGNTAYQWLNCDSNFAIISGENSQSFTAMSNGNYAVELTENGCKDTSACVPVTTVGTFDNNLAEAIIVSPNPNDGSFSLEIPNTLSATEIKIYNTLGEIVYQKNITSQRTFVNTSLSNGLYFLQLETNKGVFNKKVAIEH